MKKLRVYYLFADKTTIDIPNLWHYYHYRQLLKDLYNNDWSIQLNPKPRLKFEWR